MKVRSTCNGSTRNPSKAARPLYDVAAQVGAFLKTSSCVNIPGGEATMSGVRYADGKQVLLTLDIATGEITCTETDDAREITTLIPMN